MNSARISETAWWSSRRRLRMKESISSMKMMHGASFLAREKVALTRLCDSPDHCDWRVESDTLRNRQSEISFAIALASIVFPVPGGPYSSTPLGGPTRGRTCFGQAVWWDLPKE